jgi:lauroyl/myristoyl acyltransferase
MKEGGPFSEGVGPAFVYFAFRLAAGIAERLPLRAGDAIARFGGRAAYLFARRKRRIVRGNLARVVGESADLNRLVREAFHSYARYWLETFRISKYSRAQLLEMVHCDTFDVVKRLLDEKKGLVIVTAHLGFYDLGVAWFGAMRYPVTTVAEVLRPRALFQWFAEKREVRGMPVIPARPADAARERLLEIVRGGGGVALLSERDLGRRGIWVELFGEKTTVPAFPALLVAMTGVPMVAGAMYSTDRGYELIFEDVPYQRSGDATSDAEGIAQNIAAAVEKLVRRAPQQWHLFSTNWPSDEPGLPPRGVKALT